MANPRIPENYFLITCVLQHALVQRAAATTFAVFNEDPEATAAGTAVAAGAIFAGSLMGGFSDDVTLTEVRATVQLETGEYASSAIATSYAGTGSLARVTPAVACLVRKETARPGRVGRGRMFLPWFLSEADISEGGIIDADEVAARQTLVSDFRADLDTGGVPMQLLHGEGAPGGDLPTYVTALTVDNMVATQRRRQR